MNSVNVLNGVPCPQRPKRTIYAIFRGSDAPVADAYTTRAFGNLKSFRGFYKFTYFFFFFVANCNLQYTFFSTNRFCNSSAVKPVLVGLLDPVGHRFFALWHSSKIIHPSKSDPHHCSNCFSRDLYLLLFPVDSLISAEYVLKITPFFTLPFTVELIFAYFN